MVCRLRVAPFALALALAFVNAFSSTPRAHAADAAASVPADTTAVGAIREEAKAIRSLYKSKLVGEYLDATARLPLVQPRALVRDSSRTHYWTAAEAAAFPDTMRVRLVNVPISERFYWYTRYGTPLAYSRALEIAANAGFGSPDVMRRAFVRRLGLTPRRYREIGRRGSAPRR